jgi:vacuolar-type H+-ATPase subunit I/STV1
LLTINDNDKTTLKKQVAELTEKSKEENYIIKGKLAEKEKEIEAAAGEAEHTKQDLQAMKARLESFERTEEVREEKMRRNIERTNQRLAQFTAGWTDEMREIYVMLHRLTEKSHGLTTYQSQQQ